jgi:hypothetical protein
MFIVIYNKNWLFVAHHIGSLIAAITPISHPDYWRMMQAIYWLKLADTFSYINKCTEASYLPVSYPSIANFIQEWSLAINVVMSMGYRVLFPLSLYPFYSKWYQLMASMFHVVNFWWMLMTYKKLLTIVDNRTLVYMCSFIPYKLNVEYNSESSDSESSDSSTNFDQHAD